MPKQGKCWQIIITKRIEQSELYKIKITQLQNPQNNQIIKEFYQMDSIQEPKSLRILKCTDQNLTFFTDPASPYQTAPSNVREIFATQTNNDKSIKLVKPIETFQPKPGKTHICTALFPTGAYYYTCRECCNQNQPGVTMCYCEPCWDQRKHVGHNFRKLQASSGAYCDCGREQRIKSQSFCENHSDKSDQIIDIPFDQQQRFVQYFTSLILCAFYIKTNDSTKKYERQIEAAINKSIENLCSGSLYYIRLVTIIFQKQVEINNQTRPILEWVLKLFKAAEKMLFAMSADNLFKFMIVKAWIKLTTQGWRPEQLRLVQSQLYETDDIFFRLAQSGQYLWEKRAKYFDLAQRSEKGVELLKKFIQNQKATLKSQQWITFVLASMTQKSYPFIKSQKGIVETLLQCLLEGNYDLAQNMTPDRKNSAISMTSLLLFCLMDCKLTNLEHIYQHPIIKSRLQGLERFISYVIANIRYFVFRSGSQKQNWLMVPLYLISKSPNRSKLLTQLWQGIVQADQQLRQYIIEIIVSIYHMCAIVTNSSIFFNQLTSDKPEQHTNLEQEKQNWIKSFLYENGEITRAQVLSMRGKGLFKFPNSSRIFKDLCTYLPNRDVFQYISTQKYPNYSLRFKQERSSRDLSSIPTKNFKISDEFQFENKPQITEILHMLFGGDEFVDSFCGRWWDKYRTSVSVQERISFWKNSDLSFYYVLTLLYSNVFSGKSNKKLQEEISKIVENSETRNIILSLSSAPEKIIQMLEIDQGSQKNILTDCPVKTKCNSDDEKTIQLTSEELQKKKLRALKKQKLMQKFQKSSQKFKSQQQKPQSEEQNQCIICREPNKDNDKLMYICNFEKNASISFCLYGNQDKSEVTIGSCFHFIHSKCFLGINKNGFDFNCPLCTRKSNMYLPTSHQDKKSVKRCGNLINAIQVVKYKNTDFGSLLIVYVKHLTASYGLNSLVSNQFYEKQKKNMRKIDSIILEMAQDLSGALSQNEREDFEEQYQQFEKQIDLCTKEGLKIVQKLFSSTIYNKVFKIEPIINQALLQQVHDRIIPQEYKKIAQILTQLTQQPLKLVENDIKSEQNMVSISFKKLYPPASTNEFDNYSTQICNLCQKQKTTHVCVLCSKSYCTTCLKNQHPKQHNLNFLALELSSKKLTIRQLGGKVNGVHNIYFDSFMSAYEDRQKYDSQEIYLLNMPKIEKLLMSFILRTEVK